MGHALKKGNSTGFTTGLHTTLVRSLLAATLWSSYSSQAVTYWVSPSGNDANPGTQALPWLIPQKAADMAQAGDTAYFMAGTYNITSAITIRNSGTSNAWIVFSAAPGAERQAIIEGGTGYDQRGAWFASGKSYIKIAGFTIQNVQPNGPGIWIRARETSGGTGSATGIRIDNCRIYNTSSMGIAITGVPFPEDVTQGNPSTNAITDIIIENCEIERTNEPSGVNECISVGEGVANIIVRNNHIHHSDQYGIDFKEGVDGGEIHGNHIHHMEKHGIYLDAFSKWVRNIKVSNNRIHDNGGAGICLTREDWQDRSPELSNVEIFNNLIYEEGHFGFLLYQHSADNSFRGMIDNIRFTNNTIYHCGTDPDHGGWAIQATHGKFSLNTVYIRNNIVWNMDGGVIRSNPNVVFSNNIRDDQDPLFADVSLFDFHLLSSSPAIDAGTATDAPTFDYDNAPRPQGGASDIGAYEFGDITHAAGDDSKTVLKVFPNPTAGELRITNDELRINNSGSRLTDLRLYDVYGQAVLEYQQRTTNNQQLNISHLPAGIYMLEVTAGGERSVHKVMKR